MSLDSFERTNDRKVAALLRPVGRRWRPVVRNTHGFPAGTSCPGRTTVCAGPTASLTTGELERLVTEATNRNAGVRDRSTHLSVVLAEAGHDPSFPCYVVEARRNGTEENGSWRNWGLLRPHLDDAAACEALLAATFDEFLAEAHAADVPPIYRLHWGGDIPSLAYAEGLAGAMTSRPELRVWTYTRSFFAAPLIATVPNLVTYLSVDADNLEAARELLSSFPTLRVATLSADGSGGDEILARLGRRRSPICPVDTARMAISVRTDRRGPAVVGQAAVGACAACGLCVEGRRDVRFVTRRKRLTSVSRPAVLDEQAWRDRHLTRRSEELVQLFDRLSGDLSYLGVPTWRRHYVTFPGKICVGVRHDRLVVTWYRREASLPTRCRDISAQGSISPGDTEFVIRDDLDRAHLRKVVTRR